MKRMTTGYGIVFGDVLFSLSIRFPAKWWLLADVYLPVQRKGLKLNTSIRPNRKFTTKVTNYTVYISPNRLL